MRISCNITENPIVPTSLRNDLEIAEDLGGFVSFEGIVRNINLGKHVTHIIYEAYEELARKEIEKIAREAAEKWPAQLLIAHHRIGKLAVGDTAVYIAAAAQHRDEAFKACRYLIDELKLRAPIWKQEFFADGTKTWTRCSEHGVSHYD